MAERFLYFAYGSNMLTRRLQARTPSARVHNIGYVTQYRLTFFKASDDRSGKCDMERTGNAGDRVDGVLFWIDWAEKPALDEAERLGRGYSEATLEVLTDSGTETALAYIASETDPSRRPYHWYKALVVAGAVEHGLSAHYIRRLRAVDSQADPMPNRRTKRAAEAALEAIRIVD